MSSETNMPVQNSQGEGDNVKKLAEKDADHENKLKFLEEKVAEYEKKLQEKDKLLEQSAAKLIQLEQKASEADKIKSQHAKETEQVETLKAMSEDTLTKAKAIIFENTKVMKNQELQIEALTMQIESMKDVVKITKDLLEIRNLEVKQLEEKITMMEDRTKAEKQRQDLLHQKLESMIRHNGELKREYETQLCLFKALRERYNERELAVGVVDELRANRTPTPNGDAAPAKEEEGKAPDQPSTSSSGPSI